ncbi:MAG: ParB/RepB/Spo0J family partition protein [Proteobacteria bacterium]|nr:ParB/RepB/Spo0J family partition protein [Pseudomonadota bacterium]
MASIKKSQAKKTKAKRARLGRGLDALLGGGSIDREDVSAQGGSESSADRLESLPVEWLQRGEYQPRTNMGEEALQDLAASISTQGIVQPILVRELAPRKYEIIAGERRWRAAQIAQLTKVPVIIRKVEDEAAIAVALIENIQREDLSALEEARGISRLLEEFGLTHQQAATSIGRSRTAVTNLLRLLALHPGVQEMLEQKMFDMGHARALLSVPEMDQVRAAQAIVKGKMSVRQAELWVKKFLENVDTPKKAVSATNPDILRLEDSLANALGAKIKIQDAGGKGKLLIHYHSLDELDGIIARIESGK